MKILSIGNSFSQDATRYLQRVGASGGTPIKTVNLYIGGCSLRTHYFNMLEDKKAYMFEFNGETTGLYVTIKDALMSDNWDYVTLQQVSNQSPKYDTYTPYLEELAAYVRKYSPKSKILMHETWAYEEGSARLTTEMHYEKSADMLADIRESYKKAAEAIGADGIIPAGEAMVNVVKNGIPVIHRDTFHASWGAGRFLLALTWYAYLTGKSVDNVNLKSFDTPVSDEEIAIIKKTVAELMADCKPLN